MLFSIQHKTLLGSKGISLFESGNRGMVYKQNGTGNMIHGLTTLIKKTTTFFVSMCLIYGHSKAQNIYFTPRGEQLILSDAQKLAVFWLSAMSDSLKTDSAFKKSAIPFNWDGDSIVRSRVELRRKIKPYKLCPDIIDTVFNSPDSVRKYFIKSPQRKFEIVQIDYYICNSLRSHTILIAVDSNENMVIGYYWIGNFKSRRRIRSE